MLLLAIASLAVGAPEPPRCKPAPEQVRTEDRQPRRARPLNEMPDARPVLTVYREVDGCRVLLVRENSRIVEEPTGQAAESASIFRR